MLRGDNVAAATRSTEDLLAAVGGLDASRLLALDLDVRDEAAVAQAIRATTERFGGLDVVVNNAGYGFLAAVEEVTDAEARRMFDVQVFGVWNVLRAALPILRAQGSGHVINVSSILGLTTFPGWGLYSAGKYALEGLSGSLAAEVAEFGVKVTVVEPGYMRTDFLRPNSLGLPAVTETATGYESIREMTKAHQAMPGTSWVTRSKRRPPSSPSRSRGPLRCISCSGRTPTRWPPAARRRWQRTSKPGLTWPGPLTSRPEPHRQEVVTG